ncbi:MULTISPECIES: SusC/RagA family TonB-linked outer membrane protein [Chitinophagaceae]
MKKSAISRKYILLQALFWLMFSFSYGQNTHQGSLKGIVSTKDGKNIADVEISVYDNSKAFIEKVYTNKNGEFDVLKLSVDSIYTLGITANGYNNQTLNGVLIKKTGNLVFVQMKDSATLEEVVVVGYGTQKRINLSGAVQSVSGKVLASRPLTNLSAGLQGVIPNLNIYPGSGRPDDAAAFNVRGIASISSSGVPLILVDNVPISATEAASINPSDVANVSVLKDAGAAAIYGARAAFGVVLITTKSGTSKDLQIAFDNNLAYRTRGNGPDIITDPLTVMQYKHDAATPLYDLFPAAQQEYAQKLKDDPSLPNVIVSPTDPNSWAYYGSTNWLDEVYQTNAPTYNGNISLAQKTDRLSYYLSAGYYRQDGLLALNKDIFKRYNLRSNATFQVTKWWKIGNNTAYTYTDYNYPTFMDGYLFWNVNRTPSLSVVYNPDGTYTSDGASIVGALKDGGRSAYNINDLLTTFNTDMSFFQNSLHLKGDATFRRTNQTSNGYNSPIQYRTGPDQALSTTYPAGSSSYFSQSFAQNGEIQTQGNVYNLYGEFNKTIGKHYLNLLVGFNQEYRKRDSSWTRRQGLITSSLPSVQLATGTVTTGQTIGDYALRGLFFRANYIFDNKYIFEFNGRRDGSSRFPSSDRWGFFPSASLAWVISKEQFFAPIANALDIQLFKLRGSLGTLGNQLGNSYYPYIATMTTGNISQILDGNQPTGVYTPGVVSPSLTWEKVRSVNIGTDMSLLQNHLDISYDWYTRYTEGMLTKSKTLPGVFGATEPVTNAANLKTRGWELSVIWRDTYIVSGSPLHLSARLSLADSKAYITKYDNPTGSLSDYRVGQQIGEIWGLTNDGFFQNQSELDAIDQTAVGSDDQQYKFYVGDLKFKDLNNDGKVTYGSQTLKDHGDQKIIGNSSARLPYSLDFNTDWKGFDLRVFLQGIGKRDWYPTASNIYFWGVYAQPWTNVTKLNMDHWTPENPNAYFPRLKAYIAEDKSELGYPQTRYLQDASYLRIKNITLGYSVPHNWIKKWKIKNVRFYVSGENMFTITKLKAGLDPEGLDGSIYPFQKTYSFGFNVNL